MGHFVGQRRLKEAGDEQMSLIYSMHLSVDGYVEDEYGRFDWVASFCAFGTCYTHLV